MLVNWQEIADLLLSLGYMHAGQREFLNTLQPDAASFIVEDLLSKQTKTVQEFINSKIGTTGKGATVENSRALKSGDSFER